MSFGAGTIDVSLATNCALLCFLVISAVSVAVCENLLVNTVVLCAFGLTMAASYLVMDAPDVAITEASVGGGFGTVLLLITLSRLKYNAFGDVGYVWWRSRTRFIFTALISVLMFLALAFAVLDLPEFGDKRSLPNGQVARYYLGNTYPYMGIPNVVTAVLASFRGYDTMCETLVVFMAAIGVSLLLGRSKTSE
ncbi:MAG: DUF4040 domain-containing protein [Anaplasma sp.]